MIAGEIHRFTSAQWQHHWVFLLRGFVGGAIGIRQRMTIQDRFIIGHLLKTPYMILS